MPISLAETGSIVSIVTEALTTVAGDMKSVVTSVTPVALGVITAVMVVTFGVKVFRNLVRA